MEIQKTWTLNKHHTCWESYPEDVVCLYFYSICLVNHERIIWFAVISVCYIYQFIGL